MIKQLVSAGVETKVEEVLNKIGIPYDLYDEIKPNPTIKKCYRWSRSL